MPRRHPSQVYLIGRPRPVEACAQLVGRGASSNAKHDFEGREDRRGISMRREGFMLTVLTTLLALPLPALGWPPHHAKSVDHPRAHGRHHPHFHEGPLPHSHKHTGPCYWRPDPSTPW